MNIDKVDRIIIECLEEDGRIAYATIAKKVGLTSTAVSQRVQKLIDQDVILGFGVQLNQQRLGNTQEAMISIKLNFAKIDAFVKIMSNFSEVEYCFRVTGEECIIMKANFRDNAHLLNFLNQVSNYGFSKSSIILERIV